MKEDRVLTGKVVSGKGEAAFFTQLEWVQGQCSAKLGFRPYPGTLNLEVTAESLRLLRSLPAENVVRLVPPDPEFCEARAFPAAMGGIPCAIVAPDEAVRIHGETVIEVMAPVRLKTALNVTDGDRVTVTLTPGG